MFPRSVIALSLLACASVVWAEEAEDEPKKSAIEFPSPDGKFAFRYSGGKGEDEKETYELIEKESGKVVKKVAESEPDLGASARFSMENVLWRADSKAFALVATLMKRGRSLFVFMREGSTFREVKLPRLSAEIPEKVKKGKNLDHVSELHSHDAKQWQKDGSLVVEIETIEDGDGVSITATRNVVLGFDQSGKAKILKSTIRFATEKH